MNVRHATPEDAEAIAKVHVAGWRTAYRGFVPDAELDALRWQDRVADWRERTAPGSTVTVLVAEDDGGLVGFASSGPPRDEDLVAGRAWELYAIYLGPSTWRRGVGTALLRSTIEAVPTHVPALVLWVLDGNARARGFYERNGFVPDGTTVPSRLGPQYQDLRYRIEIPRSGGEA
ncbi:GNAT family N-acetyltransferase [Actinomadura rupiterrae]|uniref:GNAT family N-acetyltransferase n=1 Tax=Actinomadura rupiterrae TaxID=559627 RepID=UPI0020A4E1DA|nr:GNAT family N-acetyltransferase [Actinomadura rupiterrae]MCP2335845.1 RimJ/RimL family protein N-acetyltransferase [Actinomadura rupiterrae]